MHDDLEARMLRHIRENYLDDDSTAVDRLTPLADSGTLDSVRAFHFFAWIQFEFGVVLPVTAIEGPSGTVASVSERIRLSTIAPPSRISR